MRIPLAITFSVLLVVLMGVRTYNYVVYDQNVGGYLKRAADANTVPLAKENLETALKYIERQGWTSGYTSVLWRTPDEDVGFWYKNLKSSLEELGEIGSQATQLEKTNVLMKLRETLLDEGKGTSVTAPEGLSIYPDNKTFFFLMCAALILTIVSWVSATVDEFRDFR